MERDRTSVTARRRETLLVRVPTGSDHGDCPKKGSIFPHGGEASEALPLVHQICSRVSKEES